MTSTPVNVQGFATGSVYGANRMQTAETKGDFSKIFESQKSASDDVEEATYADKDMQEEPQVQETREKEDVAEINRTETDEKSTTVNETNETESTPNEDLLSEDEFSEEELEQMIAVLGSTVTDLKDMLMQELQITEDELNELMQELDLSDLDLLQLGNVKELVLQAVGAQDMTAVLTDENLYSQMKSIENEFADIMQEVQAALDLNEEDIPMITEQVEEYRNLQKQDGEKPITIEVESEPQVTEQEQLKVATADKSENSDKGQNLMQGNNAFTEPQMMTGNNVNVQSASEVQTTSYATAETENIMRQIMDHMNIRLTAETTELDMQLQPETLGTLQIKISAKEGIMTAQFTTASETVKGVLESQMIQLQQQLEQQNIKVEAIEVTVQSHAFESALEKGNEHQASEEETKKNRTRRIDLLSLDGTTELESEEQLLAEMMEANGNTVDYLV